MTLEARVCVSDSKLMEIKCIAGGGVAILHCLSSFSTLATLEFLLEDQVNNSQGDRSFGIAPQYKLVFRSKPFGSTKEISKLDMWTFEVK